MADKEDKSVDQQVCPCNMGEAVEEEDIPRTSDKHRMGVEHSQLGKDNDDEDTDDHGSHAHTEVGPQLVS